MARPKGTKYIETPEKMWELFEAYRQDVKDNPIKNNFFVGKNGNSEFEKLERPLTIEGFRTFARMNKGSVEHYL